MLTISVGLVSAFMLYYVEHVSNIRFVESDELFVEP